MSINILSNLCHECIVPEHVCPNCRSVEHGCLNTTNHATLYHCSNCNYAFNPPSWECPGCNQESSVSQSPLDDPWEYYCYRCDLAFNRLGPIFEPKVVEREVEIGTSERPTKRLALIVDEPDSSPRGVYAYTITLRNVGSDPIRTQGDQPIAVQYQIDKHKWWTIYGNPERFTPAETATLQPEQRFQWRTIFSPSGISGPDFSVSHDPLPSGTYRFVYWGVSETDAVLATHLQVDFENGW